MALFRWKKQKDEAKADEALANGQEEAGKGDFQPQPEKARKWFDHARSMADRFDYDYALTCYASGLKLDPESMQAHEEMFETAVKYMNKGGKPASNKEVRKIADSTPISRFAAAEFAWMKDFKNPSLALKTLEAAVKAEQFEFGNWIAPRVLNLLRHQKKPSKSALAQAKDLFKEVGAWDEAISIGEFLLQQDPSNNDLAAELKDMSAQRAMDQGGYEAAAGEEGGFRKYIKDEAKQRELVEAEQISSNESAEERNLQRARQQYEENPQDPDAIAKYGQLLRKKGEPEAIKRAYEVYTKGFADTKEYRFRMFAGDLKIDQYRRRLRKLKEKLEQSPDDESLKKEYSKTHEEMLKLQSKEYNERVEKYPTDRYRKFDLGTVEFELGNYESAMGQFQASKDEPKLKVKAGHLLGKCFAKTGWHPEAVAEFQEALGSLEATNRDYELEIRYDLMVSLIEQARSERSIDIAREALEICSGIARKNITYRDIRGKRKEIDELIKELSEGGSDE